MEKDDFYVPSVIDFAYEIIKLHQDNMRLRQRIERHEEMEQIHLDSIASSDKHQKEFLGIILSAAIDPDSAVNRGQAALIREEIARK